MAILGLGTDLVETARVARMIADHGDRFLDRVFTPAERAYCSRSVKRHHEHLAGRFAAKEAVMKVLGTGWRGGIAWTDIEVLPDAMGRPVLTITGVAGRVAAERGITAWHVSISHIETHAMATAVGESASRI